MAEPAKESVVRSDKTAWVKLLMGGGLGVVIAAGAVKYLMDEGATNNAFLRTTVTENASAMRAVADSLEETNDQLDELSDDHKQLIAKLGPLTRKLDEVAVGVMERVEQEKAAAK